jgi:YVTN family beta-propeller protein
MRHPIAFLVAGGAILALASSAGAVPPQYESPQIHPIAVSGSRVLVVNTPDNRLSVFDWQAGVLTLEREVRVGMEPVSVAALDATRAWVVNHLSDDVSVVDVQTGVVLATLVLGDEPADVVFVDDPVDMDGSKWAVVSLSQENRVVVVDAEPPYAVKAKLSIPGEDPRALAVDADGTGVWVAVFESGNRTTIVPRAEKDVGPWSGLPGGLPPIVPPLDPALPDSLFPDNGVIVKKIGAQWLDEQGGDWSSVVTWDLLDADVIHVDVSTATPSVGTTVQGVGTLLYDLEVDASGRIWVAGTEARNEIFFEPKLQGIFADNVLTEIDGGTFEPTMRSLNGGLVSPVAPSEALAIPNEVLLSAIAGQDELYVASIGGQRIAVVDPATASVTRRLIVPEGVTGLVDAPDGSALLAANRFTNTLHVIDPVTGDTGLSADIAASGWDPSHEVSEGRRFLYTGAQSMNGDLACATCHPHANMDALAWDLGDPTGELQQLPPENNNGVLVNPFHPLKGPMTTQTFRGLADTQPFHWRGDRSDFTRFNPAFVSLLGGDSLSTGDMQAFESFILSIDYPPNPWRDHRNEPPATWPNGGVPAMGEEIFRFNENEFCNNCHALPFGTNTEVFALNELADFGKQPMKVAQLRNLYEKTGFEDRAIADNTRGFGYLHDGQDDGLDRFILHEALHLTDPQRPHVVAFLMTFDTGTHGAVGMQATLSQATLNHFLVLARLDDLREAADAGEVGLIAHGSTSEGVRGFRYLGPQNGGTYQSDRNGETWLHADLVDAVVDDGGVFTFMAVPPGQSTRMGIDRDLDGIFDRTELDDGTDPASPDAEPVAVEPGAEVVSALTRVTSAFPQPFRSRTTIEIYMAKATDARVDVFDVSGRRIRTLAADRFGVGAHTIAWDGHDGRGARVAPGVYLVQLRAAGVRHSMKVIRIE